MRADCNGPGIQNLFLKNKIICNEIKCDVKNCISSTRCCITERLQIHQPSEKRVKKINQCNDPFFNAMELFFHQRIKIRLEFPAGKQLFLSRPPKSFQKHDEGGPYL